MKRKPRRYAIAALPALLLLLAAPVASEVGDVKFKRDAAESASIPPAVFPHWIHRMQFKCAACHDDLFPMKAGGAKVTMEAITAGKSCGTCHNAKLAFPSTLSTCSRCHYD